MANSNGIYSEGHGHGVNRDTSTLIVKELDFKYLLWSTGIEPLKYSVS